MTPFWIVRNLKEYGNCALPNAYLKKDRQELIEKLSKDTGEKISIRECEFHLKEDFKFGSNSKKNTKTSIYLVAEVVGR